MADPKLMLVTVIDQCAKLHQSYKIVKWQLLVSAKVD